MPMKKNLSCLLRPARVCAAGAALVMSIGIAAPALADSADGTIEKLDAENNSLTLSNGKTYKLPGEFDYSGFRAGQKVTVFYDTDPSGSYISDIEVQGANAADTETPAENEGDGVKPEAGNPDADTAAPGARPGGPENQNPPVNEDDEDGDD